MTDYLKLQSLITDYDVLANVERGYNGGKVEAAFQAVSAECARLGVSITEGRRLASIVPGTRKVEVQGPAHVLTNGYEVREVSDVEAARAGGSWFTHFVPAGASRFFAVVA